MRHLNGDGRTATVHHVHSSNARTLVLFIRHLWLVVATDSDEVPTKIMSPDSVSPAYEHPTNLMSQRGI